MIAHGSKQWRTASDKLHAGNRRILAVYRGGTKFYPEEEKEESGPYLKFESDNPFTLRTNNNAKNWNGVLEWSTDTTTWTTWNGTEIASVGNVLYLRGTGNIKITGGSSEYRWVLNGSDIRCIGNIENLLDYGTVANGEHPEMADSCYMYMFLWCTALIQAPKLPAMILANSCYRAMFYGCTSLTEAPELPATTLLYNCYAEMFYECSSLVKPPKLPASVMAYGCYSGMFLGCTSLIDAPALTATELAESCYIGMFDGCSSLVYPPALPSTVLYRACYESMFHNCTSLIQIPNLPAINLAVNCYAGMFLGCSKLKLSTTQNEDYSYSYRIPTSGRGITANNALWNMFYYTGGTFTGTPRINTTYYTTQPPV